jgi:rfaE bifunctional protein nucleotidyltransferase chain/domain
MHNIDIIRSKVMDLPTLLNTLHRWRFFSKKIAFTNGCFDLLHLGHVDYLAKAADEADFLVIGVNTDESTRRLKGQHRPINNEEQRTMLLAALHFVSAVVLFNEDTPKELIHAVKPDVLIKGGDYSPENIVGADFVTGNGGRVMTIDFLPGYSTTAIEERIRARK